MNKLKEAKKLRNKLDKQWREKIRLRDKTCQICHKRGKRLNAHHLVSRSNAKFRHDLDNGILLCPFHHMFSREISAHKGSFAFMIWFINHKNKQFIALASKLEVK